MKKSILVLVSFAVMILVLTPLFAEKTEKKSYVTNKVEQNPPLIDGQMNDPAWDLVEWENDFVQHEPYNGQEPSQKTSFKVLYDNSNLYIGIRAHDTEADKIDCRLARRDQIEGDFVGVQIDSYFDHSTAFTFIVSAGGVKMDGVFTNNGENEDWTLDPIWYTKTSVDGEGWTAEIKIPLSQLRYGKKEEQVWGLEVARQVYRKEELSLWQPIEPNAPGWVHNFGELRGISGLKPPRRIELLPYVVGKAATMEAEEGNPFITGKEQRLNFGLDGKIGLTSDLTVDFTINPDFGQVESDPSVVNLTAYETYFEEKRPFFIEGKNIFAYGLMIGDGDLANNNLFYSRRIGRRPSYEPDTEDNEYIHMPRHSTILGAVKISGKTKDGLSIGVLDAVTQEEKAEIDSNGKRRFETVAPMTNYFVSRVQKDYNQGVTSIGGIFTNTSRNLEYDHLEYLNKTAFSGGFDFSHSWKERTWFIQGKTVFSHIAGTEEAMIEQQRSSRRYFQRPDQNYVKVDSSRTTLSGYGGSLFFGKQGTSHFNFVVGGYWNSPGFEINDIGYMQQTDQIFQFTWVGLRWWEPFSIFRNMNINFNQWGIWNFGRDRMGAGGNVNMHAQFKNYWGIGMGFNVNGRSFSTAALRGGPGIFLPGNSNLNLNVNTDQRKAVHLNAGVNHNRRNDDISNSYNVNAGISIRPSKTFSLSMSPFYNRNINNLQYIDGLDYGDDSRYIFGRINQRTLGMVLRLNYNITPNLSVQYYGQPFVSAATYTHIKYITDPRADRYEDRFYTFTGSEIEYRSDAEAYYIDEDVDGSADYAVDYPDFNFRQFLSNLVVRWEYSPGLTLYLVWSQGRTDFMENGAFSIRNDMRDLFTVHPHNVFLLKFNHWFSL